MSRTIQQLLIALIVSTLTTMAVARDYSGMYSQAKLKRVSEVYGNNLRLVLYEDIKPHMLVDELKTLGRITLLQPWDRTLDPFEFSANAESGIILIPAFSLKFLDDLAIAAAWYERYNCDKQAIFDYVSALDFSDKKLPSPLNALGVPEKAYELDSYVDDVSQKTLKSAMAFIVLHELGHIHHQHRPYEQITAAQAQQQEAQADSFALNILRRTRLPPMGMSLWFTALSVRDPLSEGSPQQTHPLTSSRLKAIANVLRNHPDDFIEWDNRHRWDANTIRGIAADFDGIATKLEDPDVRYVLRKRGREQVPQQLTTTCSMK